MSEPAGAAGSPIAAEVIPQLAAVAAQIAAANEEPAPASIAAAGPSWTPTYGATGRRSCTGMAGGGRCRQPGYRNVLRAPGRGRHLSHECLGGRNHRIGGGGLDWNGRGWTCALSPKTARDFPRLDAVSASSADNAWAVGLSLTRNLALHWNGRTWKQVMTPRPGLDWSLHGVAVIPRSGHAWAVGQTTDRRTLMLYWNGTAWH
jgi:hypothetical protein